MVDQERAKQTERLPRFFRWSNAMRLEFVEFER
jgi:hypothetical protein